MIDRLQDGTAIELVGKTPAGGDIHRLTRASGETFVSTDLGRTPDGGRRMRTDFSDGTSEEIVVSSPLPTAPITQADIEKLEAKIESHGSGQRKGLSDRQVAKLLGVDPATVQRLVADAKSAGMMPVPWKNTGRGLERQHRRWDGSKIDAFLEELDRWRGGNGVAAADIKSVGELSPVNKHREPSRAQRKARKNLLAKSKDASGKAGTGSLRSLAESLSSKMSRKRT